MPPTKRYNEAMDEGSRKRAKVDTGHDRVDGSAAVVRPKVVPKPAGASASEAATSTVGDENLKVSTCDSRGCRLDNRADNRRHSTSFTKTLMHYDHRSLVRSANASSTNHMSSHAVIHIATAAFQHGSSQTGRRHARTAELS